MSVSDFVACEEEKMEKCNECVIVEDIFSKYNRHLPKTCLSCGRPFSGIFCNETCASCGKQLTHSGAYCCDAENERRLAEGRTNAAARKARGEKEKMWFSQPGTPNTDRFDCKKCGTDVICNTVWGWKEEGLCSHCRPGYKGAL